MIEINFLEKKENKYAFPLLCLGVFILLIIIATVTLFVQKNLLMSNVEENQVKVEALEKELLVLQNEVSDRQLLQKVEKDMENLLVEETPSYPLFQEITQLLPNDKHLEAYEMSEHGEVMIESHFKVLEDIASYIEMVDQLTYVEEVTISEIDHTASDYLASLLITINHDQLLEELNEHVQTMD